MRKASWNSLVAPSQPLELLQSFALLRSALHTSGVAHVAPMLGSHLPGCQFAWESVLEALRADPEFSYATIRLAVDFMREVYKEIKIQPDVPYVQVRTEVLVVMMMTMLEVSTRAVGALSGSPATVLPVMESLVPLAPVFGEVLYLFEFCLKKYASEMQLCEQVTILCGNALEAGKVTVLALAEIRNPGLQKSILEELFRVLMSTGNYITAIAGVGAGSSALSQLLQHWKGLYEAALSVPDTERVLDCDIGAVSHNYLKCGKGCGVCTGNQSTLRCALISFLTPPTEAFINSQIKSLVLWMLREAVQHKPLSQLSQLNYAFLYLAIDEDAELPSDFQFASLGTLFRIYRDRGNKETLEVPRWASPLEVSQFLTALLKLLESQIDKELLFAIIDFASGLDSTLQGNCFKMLERLFDTSTGRRYACARLNVFEKLLAPSPLSEPAKLLLSRLCTSALYPNELCAVLSRFSQPSQATSELRFFLNLLLSSVTSARAADPHCRSAGCGNVWKTDTDVYHCAPIEAIRSLGGIPLILQLFDHLQSTGSEYDSFRVLILRLIHDCKDLLTRESVEFLSIKLEESSDQSPLSEDSIILLQQLFSEFTATPENFKVAAQNLILVPKLWERLPHREFHAHFTSVTLHCVSHFSSQKFFHEALRAGKLLLDEIWRRKSYSHLSSSIHELGKMIEFTLVQSGSESLICEWLFYGLKSLDESVEKCSEICSHVLSAVSVDTGAVKEKYARILALVWEFAKRLNTKSGAQGLTQTLALIFYNSCFSRRFVYNSLTGRLSARTGIDEAFMPLMQRLIKELDFDTYKKIADIITDEWDLADARKRNTEEIKSEKLVILTNLLARCSAEGFQKIWDDFAKRMEKYALRFAFQPNFPKWIEGVFEKALSAGFDCRERLWPSVSKLFLAKGPAGVGPLVRAFLYHFWRKNSLVARAHIPEFLKSFLRGAQYPLVRDLFLVVEEAVLCDPALASDLLPLFADQELLAALLEPPSDDSLPILPYEKLFSSADSCFPLGERSTAGGLRRILIKLALICLREGSDYTKPFDLIKHVLRNVRIDAKYNEDMFRSKGFYEAWTLAELCLIAIEARPEKYEDLLKVLQSFKDSDFFSRVYSLFNESPASFSVYRNLICQNASALLGPDSVLHSLDTFELRRQLDIRKSDWETLENSQIDDYRLQERIFADQLTAMKEAVDIESLSQRLKDEEWQASVLFYLLINTSYRMKGIDTQAIACLATVSRKPHYEAVDDLTLPESEYAKLENESQKIEKRHQVERMYVRYRWKAWRKFFTGVYGVWQASEEPAVWKVANFVDREGRRTRIKRKKNATTHSEAVNHRVVGLVRAKSEDRQVAALPVTSPAVSESPSSFGDSRRGFDFPQSDISIGDSDFTMVTDSTEAERRQSIDQPMIETGVEVPCERIVGHRTIYGLLDLGDFIIFRSIQRAENDIDENQNIALV